MKTVLITGASSGFGEQMVIDFLKEGWRVVAAMRKSEERSEMFKKNSNLELITLDVTKKEDIKTVQAFVQNNLGGKLDLLVNNAGYGVFGAVEDVSEEQIRRQMEVNYFGPVLLIKSLLPSIREVKGKIINISSIMGVYSIPLGGLYSSSKYALEGISEGLMHELAPFDVSVCSVRPGGHRTKFMKSIIWGEGSGKEGSAYNSLTVGLSAMMNKLSSRKNAPGAENVSNTVIKLSKANKMPRTVYVGGDAKSLALMKKILPSSIYLFVLSKAFKKMMSSK
jgi:NAD(P)-dependent dehydrogenase (short-subunit alcohol dehydrogenase family)